MKDYQAQIEKLRRTPPNAPASATLRLTNPSMRCPIACQYLTVLADQVEMAMIDRGKRGH